MDILFLAQNFTSEFSDSELLSFAGDILSGLIGLLGAGLGVYGAYYVMQKQLKAENEQYRKDRIDNTFFNLLGLFQNVQKELDSDKFIKSIKKHLASHQSDERNRYFADKFNKEKTSYIQDIETFNELTEGKYISQTETLKQEMDVDKTGDRFAFEIGYFSKRVVDADKDIFEEKFSKFNKFRDEYKDKNSKFTYELKKSDIRKMVKIIYISLESESGNYFRASYRCLKYIMDSDLKMEDKKFYSGVLRGILSSKEMLVVFYNCMYFEKGEKFKELLEKEEDGKRIDFFGDKNDLENLSEGYDLPFFSKKDLLFSETDMQKLEELIKGN